jgi:hypothetical protein
MRICFFLMNLSVRGITTTAGDAMALSAMWVFAMKAAMIAPAVTTRNYSASRELLLVGGEPFGDAVLGGSEVGRGKVLGDEVAGLGRILLA